MTYKFELFLIIQNEKKAHKYKIIQKLCFLWFTYVGLLVFYTKLIHLVQKLKKKKKSIRWDICCKIKL